MYPEVARGFFQSKNRLHLGTLRFGSFRRSTRSRGHCTPTHFITKRAWESLSDDVIHRDRSIFHIHKNCPSCLAFFTIREPCGVNFRWNIESSDTKAPDHLTAEGGAKMSRTMDPLSPSNQSKCYWSSFEMSWTHSSESQYIERKKWHSYSFACSDPPHTKLYAG